MPTLTVTVAASADDAQHQSINNDSGRNVTTGDVTVLNNTLLSPGSHSGNDEWTIGARFLGVTVPKDATINSATFSMKAQGTYTTGGAVSYLVSAQAADNPATFSVGTDDMDVTTRPRTTAVSAVWNQNSVTAGTRYSIDITSVIQEIVNRAGWVSGNAIVTFVDTDTTTTLGEWQDYYAFDDTTDQTNNPPQLFIDYTVGGGSDVTVGATGVAAATAVGSVGSLGFDPVIGVSSFTRFPKFVPSARR